MKIVTIALFFMLTGCASRTWIDSFETQPGVYYVSVDGNGYTSKETIVRTFHARASRICGGVDKYDLVSQSDSSTSSSFKMPTYNPYQAQQNFTSHKPGVEGYIRCKSPVPEIPRR